MTKQDLILNKMRELRDTMYAPSYDFVKQYQAEDINYLSGLFHDYADENVSIYYDEQRDFYYKNIDICNDAIKEFYGSFSEFAKSCDNDIYDLDDLICKAGALGEYRALLDELNNDSNEIKACLYLYEVIRVLELSNEGDLLSDREVIELTCNILHEKNFCWFDVDGIEPFENLEQVIEGLNLR